ncbi:MAG: hypothetical protein KID00_12285 [Clostridium argentinense]|uniref:DUF4363 family protein n=1 Tax=Clostridium faecium TaxID=2762223 RepID=A0ABR8YMT9_9CLOT|nr:MULTISPECIES: hypothetical protein [Clostridium]MBD8045530.1 hypothetical protein [Clostridium faecium]MBS5824604.1 hypothetical protein [Clostridium argentinense]MDU1350359.1 hypothetical protein [Clostridium argentinense]
MYITIFYIAICIVFFFFGRKNYIKKAERLNNNIREFNDEILIKYNSLNSDEKIKFKKSLSELELAYFKDMLENDFKYSNNISSIQNYILHLQDIMMKLKFVKGN